MEYLVIDTESCTGRDDDGSLCSFGYAVCDGAFNVLSQRDIIINPLPNHFFVGDKKHEKKTGIKFAYPVSAFRNSPKFSDKYEEIKNLFNSRVVLGFSMVNDVKYLNDACRKYGLPIIGYKFIDVQFVYKLFYPDENSIGLKTLSEKYGTDYLAHRSDEDAAATVTLLKRILDEQGLTLSETIEKYGIVYGENNEEGYSLNYAEAMIEKKYGLKPSKKILGLVYSDYVRKLPLQKSKKVFSFSHKVERGDIDHLRTLIDLAALHSMRYSPDYCECDVYVCHDPEDRVETRRKPKHYTVGEFEKIVGFSADNRYDDSAFLRQLFSRKIKHE